jgi:DNA-binding response OmpR family regulator
MKEKIILLVDSDADCGALVLEAAARLGHGVRLSRDSGQAFRFLQCEFDRTDALIVDVDPGDRGLALLAAISALHCRPPILVLTALEESHLEPTASRYGAVACLGKPLSPARLHGAIEGIMRSKSEEFTSSDCWGHPRPAEEEEVEDGASV